MKNKIIGVLIVLLIIANIVLIVSVCKYKNNNSDLEKRVEELEKTVDVHNNTIMNVQNDMESIKIEYNK